jgi:hypothetical protein
MFCGVPKVQRFEFPLGCTAVNIPLAGPQAAVIGAEH